MNSKRCITLLYVILTSGLIFGQPGSWRDHLSYYSATGLAVSSEKAYIPAGEAIYSYEFATEKTEKLSKVHGLTESGIKTIAYSQATKTLVIAYNSTNVDLYTKGIIYNMADIKRANIQGKKVINRIRCDENYAYLTCSFGIVVIDLAKREIKDTWRPTNEEEVYDIAFTSTSVFAATGKGIWTAPRGSQGLAFSGSWSKVLSLPFPDGSYRNLISQNDTLLAALRPATQTGDILYMMTPSVTEIFTESGAEINNIEKTEGRVAVVTKNKVVIMSTSGAVTRTITDLGSGSMDARGAVINDGRIMIADGILGLFVVEQNGETRRHGPEGPWFSNSNRVLSAGGITFITGGAVNNAWNNTWSPFQIYRKHPSGWSSIVRHDIHDAMKVAVDPDDLNHFFVSTWGAGLVEFQGDDIIAIYDENNSPLQSIIPGNNYERIYGLEFDNDKNLWITHSGMPGSIKVLRPDRSWITIPVTIDAPTIGELIITRRGYKWIVLPRGHGLFVFDDNRTPEIFSDDRYKKIVVTDSENKLLNTIYSIAEDQNGSIWIGTDQGPAIYYNPDKVFESDIKAYRVKVPRDDGSGLADYLLANEIITSIAVDGGNRKWLGTSSSGLFRVSHDGMKTLNYFNEENSPILSNSVSSVSVNGSTGEVWIATSNGLISYSGDATEGGEGFRGMYAYPNPVRPDFHGDLTITGLEPQTTVKITDVGGNLIFETTSNGGMATWDLKSRSGNRVSSGVYLIFCSGVDGVDAAVTKILVISRR